jgi:hypothetical protein
LKQSPINWFLYLKGKFLKVGFKQSEYDASLFISDKAISIVFVNDTLLFSPRQEYLDEIMVKLDVIGLSMEAKNDVFIFLGVLIECWDDGVILVTQTGLLNWVDKALRIDPLP